MYSPWTTSLPCLLLNKTKSHDCLGQITPQFSLMYNGNDNFLHSLDNRHLSNPINTIPAISPMSSFCSLNNQNHNTNSMHQQKHEFKHRYFEPLPFIGADAHSQYNHHLQLSQKHTVIKQMIARKVKQTPLCHSRSHYTSCDSLSSSVADRKKQQMCSFCKTNGESVDVYTSHVLRNTDNEIECPILMAYVCPKCGATGKSAHTIKYCTALSERERVALPTVKLFREGRSSSGSMNLFKKNERY